MNDLKLENVILRKGTIYKNGLSLKDYVLDEETEVKIVKLGKYLNVYRLKNGVLIIVDVENEIRD